MVKKIRLVDSEKAEVKEKSSRDKKTLVNATEPTKIETNEDLIELLKSMDWKLWELLQIGQRLEKVFVPDEES
tara:strand:- start:131 stop:349 length:219 start_codon:yes stop_codon:yes gene_type:complete